MNKVFKETTEVGRLIFLKILAEENFPIAFDFHGNAHKYLEEQYPQYYGKKGEGSFLLDAEGGIDVVGCVTGTKNLNIILKKMEYVSGDAELYNDSEYRPFTCPMYSDGIELVIPISLITGITILHSPVKGI